jgi:anti-sigma regulatory factor (Ser/Thr protein kinase)/ketosteroid isomerase-like protein
MVGAVAPAVDQRAANPAGCEVLHRFGPGSSTARAANVPDLQPHVLAVQPGPGGLSEGRGLVERVLSASRFDEAARYQITVATNEAVSNALEHGAPCDDGSVHLVASVQEDVFFFSVRDCGHFRDASAVAADPVAERGRGFAFMNLLMDDVRLEARPGETVLQLVKRLPGAAAPAGTGVEASVAEGNVRVVLEVFDAFEARDIERLMPLVDLGVMVEPLSTPVEQRTPYLGVSGLRRYLDDLDATWDEFEVAINEVRPHGDHVAALGSIYARRDNLVANDPAGFALKLRDERVLWLKAYRRPDEALAAAGAR